MIRIVCLNAMDECQLVNVFRNIWKQLRNIATCFTILSKLKRAPQDSVWMCQPSLQFTTHIMRSGHTFTVQSVQFRFVLERVHLADTPLHKQENTTLGFSSDLLFTRSIRLGRQFVVCLQDIRQRKHTQSVKRIRQHRTSCKHRSSNPGRETRYCYKGHGKY